MPNYNYVIDSSYQPFSMQEMLIPFTAYKEAAEKDEERYLELQQKAGDLADIIKTLPENSNARKQYENYYNELQKQSEDFSRNGKTMLNSRALLGLRRRYQGEIGSLEKSNNALNEELKLRRTIMAQDPTMIYANNNLSLDNYLPGAKRNDYSISGNFLSAEGAKMGEALSKRQFTTEEGKTNILGGYYIDFVNKYGIKDTKAFMQSPEFAEAMKADLASKGVYDNLSGVDLQRAIDSYRSGALKGFVYQEQHSPQRDLGVVDEATKQQLALTRRGQNISLAENGLTYNDKTGTVTYDPYKDPSLQKAAAVAKIKAGSSSSGSNRVPAYDKIQYVTSGGNPPENVENVSNKARKVNIEVKDGKYIASVGDGANKLILGTMDAKGNFTLGENLKETDKLDYDKFADHFGSTMSWYQWGHTYDPEYDNANIKALLKDVVETGGREGGKSYQNYNYYLEPDNAGYNNGGGGFYREPMKREYGTTSNENLDDFTGGFNE